MSPQTTENTNCKTWQQNLCSTHPALGTATTIGRFPARIVINESDGRLYVLFHTSDGRPFGAITLEAARVTPVVDLYESAEWMLNLPLCYTPSDYCLTAEEVEQLHHWAGGIVE